MKKAVGVALAVGLIATMMPTTAAAKPVKSRLKLVAIGLIEPNGNFEYDFAAAVGTSKKGKRCKDGRKVSVYRDEPAGPDTLIGSRRTDPIFEVALIIGETRPPS